MRPNSSAGKLICMNLAFERFVEAISKYFMLIKSKLHPLYSTSYHIVGKEEIISKKDRYEPSSCSIKLLVLEI